MDNCFILLVLVMHWRVGISNYTEFHTVKVIFKGFPSAL